MAAHGNRHREGRRRRRFLSLGAFALAVAVTSGELAPPSMETAAATESAAANLAAFRGLGSWVDIFDTYQWDHPRDTVRKMKNRGVRTLYLETGNYHSGPAIFRPRATDRFIHAAHRRGMKVVAWYLPAFRNLRTDLQRSIAAIRYRTSRNQRFDAFGLDIEAPLVHPISARIQRMLRLSRRIRERVSSSYPLGAIVPSPYGMKKVPGYWGPARDFPWARLARIYDVFVPMSYFTYRVQGAAKIFSYISFNVRLIRRETNNPEVPIHLIGGIAGDSTRKEVRAYVRAGREYGTLGGSLYAFDSTRSGHWGELASIPVNPRQSPTLPISLGSDGYGPALGNVPGEDRSHPKEVFFRVRASSTALLLDLEAYDIAADEVELQVNWRPVTTLAHGASGTWGLPQQIRIPARRLEDNRKNLIGFVALDDHPSWSTWGVRNVTVSEPGG
jgi:hypothetical protein